MIESKNKLLSGADFTSLSKVEPSREHHGKTAAWKNWWNRLSDLDRQLDYPRWLFLVIFVLFVLLAVDVYEHYQNIAKLAPSFLANIIVLVAVMVLAGLMIQIGLSKIIDHQSDQLKTLNQKNELVQHLSSSWSEEETVDLLLEYVHRFVPQAALSFFVYNRAAHRFEIAAQHAPAGEEEFGLILTQARDYCRTCMKLRSHESPSLEWCSHINHPLDQTKPEGYCLPITYRNTPIAMIRVGLKPNQALTQKQNDILLDIASIAANQMENIWRRQDHLNEKLSNGKVSERRAVARDLHDTIGQDLCYASLKLEQMTETFESTPMDDILRDLKVMRNIINTDYESIRGTLASLYPDNASRLGKLLSDHVSLVSERSGILFEMTHQGEPRPLNPESIRQIYYVCREAIHNVEKHAHASKVGFSINWEEQQLAISILDNGCGFEVEAAKPGDHFGLKIMRERIESLDGRIKFASSDLGTRVELWVPYEGILTTASADFVKKPLVEMDLEQQPT